MRFVHRTRYKAGGASSHAPVWHPGHTACTVKPQLINARIDVQAVFPNGEHVILAGRGPEAMFALRRSQDDYEVVRKVGRGKYSEVMFHQTSVHETWITQLARRTACGRR